MIRSNLQPIPLFIRTARIGIGLLLLGALASLGQQPDSDQSRVPVPPLKGRARNRAPKMPRLSIPESIPQGTLMGRFLARAQSAPISAFSPNRETYLFETEAQGSTQLVKLSHEFMDFEPRLASVLPNYGQVHTFQAIRDPSCDERWGALSTQLVSNSEGEFVEWRSALTYMQGASPPAVAAGTVVPCYVITRLTREIASHRQH